jgi:hypothetical protein
MSLSMDHWRKRTPSSRLSRTISSLCHWTNLQATSSRRPSETATTSTANSCCKRSKRPPKTASTYPLTQHRPRNPRPGSILKLRDPAFPVIQRPSDPEEHNGNDLVEQLELERDKGLPVRPARALADREVPVISAQ